MLNDVMTIKEAAELWNIQVDTLRQKCIGRVKGDLAFKDGEYNKSAGTWLIRYSAMVRLYGELKENTK